MTSLYFNSVCLSLVSFVFIVLITIMYISKNINKATSSRLFLILIIILIIELVLELIMPYTNMFREESPVLNEIVSKIYVYSIFLWSETFITYILYISYGSNIAKKFKNFNKLLVFIIGGIILVPFASILFFNLEYIGGGANGAPYTLSGTLMYAIQAFVILGSFFVLYVLAVNDKKIRNINMLPIYVTFIFYVIVLLFQVVVNYYINYLGTFASVMMAILYFTVESQDNKLVYEYNKSKEASEEANRAKTEFLITMSHKIRTPMSTILGYTDVLSHEEYLNEEIVSSDLINISNASKDLMDLINNILDISSIENNKEALKNKDYYLENIMFELNSVIPSRVNKEVKFNIEINPNIPNEFYGDSYKIYKILFHILSNALAFTSYGEVKLSVDGEYVSKDVYELKFHVKNTGHAMSNESFNMNFEDFGLVKNSDDISLGVIIAKELTNMLHGRIDFINEKGMGTNYIIRIRQKLLNDKPIGNIFESDSSGLTSTIDIIDCTGKKALIVDDSEINIKLASRYIKQFNYEISTASSGRECVEMVKTNKYDVIFLDHMMPDMDGVETIKALVSLGIYLPPIIALTANTYKGLRERFITEGFYDYLSKPINFKELSRMVNEISNRNIGGDQL